MSRVEIRAEIERGRESLAAARHLAEGGFLLDSTSRSYYAVLHFTRAILLSHQQVPKSHHGASLLFGRHIVNAGLADVAYSKILTRLMKLREEADYLTTASCSESDATRAIAESEQFMALAVSLTDDSLK
jgi:uncharacterized protein (UPF0332 family)